jgi:hypothetical protein
MILRNLRVGGGGYRALSLLLSAFPFLLLSRLCSLLCRIWYRIIVCSRLSNIAGGRDQRVFINLSRPSIIEYRIGVLWETGIALIAYIHLVSYWGFVLAYVYYIYQESSALLEDKLFFTFVGKCKWAQKGPR